MAYAATRLFAEKKGVTVDFFIFPPYNKAVKNFTGGFSDERQKIIRTIYRRKEKGARPHAGGRRQSAVCDGYRCLEMGKGSHLSRHYLDFRFMRNFGRKRAGKLIAEGNDAEYRRMKAEAEKYRKISDGWFFGWTGAYLLALVICFICNLAINKTLSWFFIVLTALMTAFSLFPSCAKFVRRGKLLAVSGSFVISLLLLLLSCCLYTHGDWFFIALTAVLFAFSVIFLPIFLALYPVPKAVKRNNPIISVGADFVLLIALILACEFGRWSGFLRGVEISALCFVPVFATAAILSYVRANGWTKAAFLCVLWGTFFLFVDALVSLIYHQPYAFSGSTSPVGRKNISTETSFL